MKTAGTQSKVLCKKVSSAINDAGSGSRGLSLNAKLLPITKLGHSLFVVNSCLIHHSHKMTMHPYKSAILFVVLSTFADIAISQSITYAPQNCDFAVRFPGTSDLQPFSVQDGQTFEQAQYFGKDYFLRAECGRGTKLPDRDIAMASVQQYAANQGLSATEFRHAKVTVGPSVYGRGTKSIKGKLWTYEMQCTFGKTSFMCLIGGAPAEQSPNQSVSAFFQTISTRSSPSNPRWVHLRKDETGRDFYLGLEGLVKEADITRVEILQNLPSPKGTPMGSGNSLVQVLEFNCRSRQMRSTESRLFSNTNGNGEIVAVSTDGASWRDASSSELMAAMLTRVCSVP